MTKMSTSQDNKSLTSLFDAYAEEYNQSRRKFIPCFDDFYKTAVEVIPFPFDEKIQVLDLGAGTGLLAKFVASAFPAAELSLIDVSKNMLARAQEDLSHFPNKCSFHLADYSSLILPRKFDVIISALSIHHLSETEKRQLFDAIFDHLSPGGIFINADQVEGGTPAIEARYRAMWLQEVKENGVSAEELHAAFQRMEKDQMSTLAKQLQWLTNSGFSEVNCWYKNYSFAVYSGRKNELV